MLTPQQRAALKKGVLDADKALESAEQKLDRVDDVLRTEDTDTAILFRSYHSGWLARTRALRDEIQGMREALG